MGHLQTAHYGEGLVSRPSRNRKEAVSIGSWAVSEGPNRATQKLRNCVSVQAEATAPKAVNF